jgi:hypothetical protein
MTLTAILSATFYYRSFASLSCWKTSNEVWRGGLPPPLRAGHNAGLEHWLFRDESFSRPSVTASHQLDGGKSRLSGQL